MIFGDYWVFWSDSKGNWLELFDEEEEAYMFYVLLGLRKETTDVGRGEL